MTIGRFLLIVVSLTFFGFCEAKDEEVQDPSVRSLSVFGNDLRIRERMKDGKVCKGYLGDASKKRFNDKIDGEVVFLSIGFDCDNTAKDVSPNDEVEIGTILSKRSVSILGVEVSIPKLLIGNDLVCDSYIRGIGAQGGAMDSDAAISISVGIICDKSSLDLSKKTDSMDLSSIHPAKLRGYETFAYGGLFVEKPLVDK